MRKMKRAIRATIDFISLYGQHLPLALSAIFSFQCTVIRIRGKLKKSEQICEFVYVGRKQNFEYLKQQLLDSPEAVEEIDSTIFTFRSHAKKAFLDSDVMLVDIGWPYHYLFNTDDEFLESPDWVSMLVETEGSLAEVVSIFRKTARAYDMRMIRKHAYSYDLVSDDEAIDHFYENLYTPFVQNTHGASAILADKKAIVKRVKQGKLLRVQYQGSVLAAGVVFPENDVLYFLWMGSLPVLPLELDPTQSMQKLPEGVISALYYFGIEHANQLGLSAVDFTGTRCILSDGTFHFKRKWGAIVEDTFSPSSVLLKLRENSVPALELARQTPLIVRESLGLEIRFVIKEPQDQNEQAAFEKIWKQHGCEGIKSLCVFNIDEALPEMIRYSELEGRPCCWVQCKRENFSRLYTKDHHDRAES